MFVFVAYKYKTHAKGNTRGRPSQVPLLHILSYIALKNTIGGSREHTKHLNSAKEKVPGVRAVSKAMYNHRDYQREHIPKILQTSERVTHNIRSQCQPLKY